MSEAFWPVWNLGPVYMNPSLQCSRLISFSAGSRGEGNKATALEATRTRVGSQPWSGRQLGSTLFQPNAYNCTNVWSKNGGPGLATSPGLAANPGSCKRAHRPRKHVAAGVFSKTETFFSEYGYRPHVTGVFEQRKYALQGGDFWKRKFIVFVWTGKNGGFQIRWRHA